MGVIVLLWVLVCLFFILNLNSRHKHILCLKILKNIPKYKY